VTVAVMQKLFNAANAVMSVKECKNPNVLIRFSAVLVIIASLAARAAAQDDPAAVARAFFTAYASGDVSGASSDWVAGDVAGFRVKALRSAAARCLVLHGVDVRVIEASGEKACVEIDASADAWAGGGSGVVAPRAIYKSLDLVSEGGEWRVAAMRDREQAVADAIAAAPKEQRAEIARGAGVLRTPLLVSFLARRAMTMVNEQNLDGAAQLLDLADEIAIERADGGAQAEVMAGRSTVLYIGPRHDVDAAVQLGEQAVSWAESAEADADVVAWSLVHLGRALDLVSASSWPYSRVVALDDRVEQVATLAQAHTMLAKQADGRSDHRAAFRHSLLAQKYADESGDVAARISAALNLGGAFLAQSDDDVAVLHYERAARLAGEAGFPGSLAFAMEHQALIYSALLRWDECLRTINEALAIGRKTGDPAEPLVRRAGFLFNMGDVPAAERDLKEVQPLLASLEPSSRNLFMDLSGRVLLSRHRCEEALDFARRYRANSAIDVPSPLEIEALECLGRKPEALRSYVERVDWSERVRGNVAADAAQLGSFQEGAEGIYAIAVQRLIEEGYVREPLVIAERLKARVLRDAQRGVLVSPARLEGDERALYQRLNERISALNRGIAAAAARRKSAERLRKELERARLSLRDLLARTNAALLAPTPPPPPPVMQDVVPSPPPGVVAIEYVMVPDYLIAFAVVRGECDPEITVRVIPIAPSILEDRIARYVASIEQRDLRAGGQARELYRLLIAPFEKLIARHDAVCFIPAGDLWRVPFHALMNGSGRYLAEMTNVYYAPSLATLHAERQREHAQPETLLAMANPNLRARTQELYRAYYRDRPLGAIPETEREVRALRSIYGASHSRIYIGDDAQEAVAKRESPKFRILHIAAHGIVDENSPMYSAVALSTNDAHEDGLLEAREIAEMHLNADLAVLSACETARGRVSIGEGVLGLSWALLAAGCPTAVVSQWRTDSESTADLMIAFHRDLVRTHHRSPVQSLRRAQRTLMRNPRTAHPYYWAPFIVIGRDQ
jgi:CHAT domain-containing protein